MASTIKLSDVGPGDIIVVQAPEADTSKWTFPLPEGVGKVWVAKVTQCAKVGTSRTYRIVGHFAWNNAKDLTEPLTFSPKLDSIDLEDPSLCGLYEWEEDFGFNEENVADIVEKVK